jgi:hypothetical protein
MEISIPLIKKPIGSGDLVKTALSTVGIQQKPDNKCKCAKRQQTMNRAVTFVPTKAK